MYCSGGEVKQTMEIRTREPGMLFLAGRSQSAIIFGRTFAPVTVGVSDQAGPGARLDRIK